MTRRRPSSSPANPAQPERGPKNRGKGGGGSAQSWLWGVHPVLAALANPDRRCQRLLATQEARAQYETVLAPLLASQPRLVVDMADRAAIDAVVAPGAVHQGLALKAEPLEPLGVEDLIDAANEAGERSRVVVVLDQVTDPHNVGAILRSAAAFGAVGLLMPERHSPEETGTLAKAASGALERLPIARTTNLARALGQLKDGGFWVAGLDGQAKQTLAEAGLSGKVALVLGAEGEGLRRLTRELCDYLVKIPQSGLVESLNVSNAAAVALYELVRR